MSSAKLAVKCRYNNCKEAFDKISCLAGPLWEIHHPMKSSFSPVSKLSTRTEHCCHKKICAVSLLGQCWRNFSLKTKQNKREREGEKNQTLYSKRVKGENRPGWIGKCDIKISNFYEVCGHRKTE